MVFKAMGLDRQRNVNSLYSSGPECTKEVSVGRERVKL